MKMLAMNDGIASEEHQGTKTSNRSRIRSTGQKLAASPSHKDANRRGFSILPAKPRS